MMDYNILSVKIHDTYMKEIFLNKESIEDKDMIDISNDNFEHYSAEKHEYPDYNDEHCEFSISDNDDIVCAYWNTTPNSCYDMKVFWL